MHVPKLLSVAPAVAVLIVGVQAAYADAIPYPDIGMLNPVTYAFTAASAGPVIAYFAGSTASYENKLGMLDNGVLTASGFGLDDHTSSIGQSFNLGTVNAGDSLVFVLDNLTLGMDAYSLPSLNVSYDSAAYIGSHNHIYSTSYTATSPILDSIPRGTFVAFEDLQFPSSDFNYNDEDFVFVNVAASTNPEPSTIILLGAGLLLVGGAWMRKFRYIDARKL